AKKLEPSSGNDPRAAPVSRRHATYFQYAECTSSSQTLWASRCGRHAAVSSRTRSGAMPPPLLPVAAMCESVRCGGGCAFGGVPRQPFEESLGVDRRHAPRPGGGNGLPVHVILHVAGREHAG